RASLNCLDNSMQKVRIKKENAPALSDRADALPVNHFKAFYGSIFYAVGIRQNHAELSKITQV
ncbi:MAG: hypothetical protein OIF54_17610, partial [Cohaesibacter sp.]|nr:hypothetical protein [Cohaesibacter sp.]